jgi:hypothetical protein
MDVQPEIEGHLMTIRRDTVFISSVLFTIALLGLVPPFAKIAFAGHDKAAFERLDWALRLYSRLMNSFSIASLSIVLIGLIVTWAGYIKKVRWTWFVMFVIVWGWAFPVLVFPDVVYPLHSGAIEISSFLGMIREALHEPGPVRGFVLLILIFVLMAIALVLPMKAFFWRSKRAAPPS